MVLLGYLCVGQEGVSLSKKMSISEVLETMCSLQSWVIETAQMMAAHESPRTTKFYEDLREESRNDTCGSRKPIATVNRQVGARVITPLAAHSGDATHPLLGLP
jgi:hypothetical protein